MSSTQNERENEVTSSTQQIQDSIYAEMASQILRTKGVSRADLIKRANRSQDRKVHKKKST